MRNKSNALPCTEPFMLLDGAWLQLGACAECGHSVFGHTVAPKWACQNADCTCDPKIDKRRRQPNSVPPKSD